MISHESQEKFDRQYKDKKILNNFEIAKFEISGKKVWNIL